MYLLSGRTLHSYFLHIPHKFYGISDPKLPEQIVFVDGDRTDTDVQLIGYFLVNLAHGGEAGYLNLPLRQLDLRNLILGNPVQIFAFFSYGACDGQESVFLVDTVSDFLCV